MTKTNNQTTTNETQNKLIEMQTERNHIIEHLLNGNNYYSFNDLQTVNAEIMQTLSEIACYKTLKFLMSNNATNGTETETTENGTVNTYGYNMALKLFNNLYNDINIMHNPEILTDILTDSADLVQESNKALIPYFNNLVIFDLQDTIYTKTLKNGNIKNYNVFQLACKSIRAYIQNQDKKQYKKLSYSLGFTDNGTEILTTKRPKNDITDIKQEQKQNFIDKYNLTTLQEQIILDTINGLTVKEIADKMQVTTRAIQKALARAKEQIAKLDKRVKF